MSTDKATIWTYATCANGFCIYDDVGLKTNLHVEATAKRTKNKAIVIHST